MTMIFPMTLPGQTRIDVDDGGIATLTLDLPGKVNVMNDDFIAALEAFLDHVEASRAKLRGVILTSAKPIFLAGGDLGLMGRATPGQEQFLFDYFEHLKGLLRRLERTGLPTVACINGSAHGGGLELALACHRRITLDRPKLEIGLPEIEFAILAGAGGVVRLTLLLGLEKALGYLLSGRRVGAQEALRDGIVDEIADDEEAMLAAARAWIAANPEARQPWDRPRLYGTHNLAPKQRAALVAAPTLLSLAPDPALLVAQRTIEVAAQALYLDFDAALRIETRALIELMVRPEAVAAIAAFFARRRPAPAPAETAG